MRSLSPSPIVISAKSIINRFMLWDIIVTSLAYGWIVFTEQGLRIWYWFRGVSSVTVFGSATFLSRSRQFCILNRLNHGLVLCGQCRLTREQSMTHALITASTGWGKSTRYVLMNLLQPFPNQPSFVVTDPSSELWQLASGYLSRQGYEVRKVDFSKPESSHSYNPLANAQNFGDCERLAKTLIQSAYPSANSDHSFWNDLGEMAIGLLAKVLLNPDLPNSYRSYAVVRHLLNEFGKDGSSLQPFFAQYCDDDLFHDVKGFFYSQETKTLQGALSTAKAALRIFGHPEVRQTTSSNTLDLQEIREKPVAIFVAVPESELDFYQVLLNLFYTDLFAFLLQPPQSDKLYRDVYVFADEFGSMNIPNFPAIISVIRKRGVSLSLILQSLSQLEERYGQHGANIILDNIGTQLYAPGMNLTTARMLEDSFGKTTVSYRNPPYQGKIQPQQYVSRSLRTADEIRGSPHPYVLMKHHKPFILKNPAPYYKSKVLRKRSEYLSPELTTDLPTPVFPSI